jgi:hypothetical protein
MSPILGIVSSSRKGGPTAAYESIASAAGTGASSTITFSSIPSTYASLQIRINGRSDALVDTTYIQVQYNATAMTKGHYVRGDGSAVSANAVNVPIYIAGANTTANTMGVGIIDIHDYASTTKNKTVRVFSGADKNASGGAIDLISGLWMSTSAINRIDLVTGSGQYQTGSTVSLYGIKGA